jgi:predicted RNA methylase
LLKILQQWPGDRRWVDERLRAIYRQWVPRWHFEMLNDVPRGQAYADALAALNLADKVVLDIGAGSGLLSMIAARSGAEHVYACEMVRPIAEKAEEIVRQNGLENRIAIIPKSSFEVEIGREMPERAQLMVSETFDYAFIGEGFRSLRHAKQTLLKPDAMLVPCGMKLCGVLIESADIHGMNCVERSQGFDVSGMNEF